MVYAGNFGTANESYMNFVGVLKYAIVRNLGIDEDDIYFAPEHGSEKRDYLLVKPPVDFPADYDMKAAIRVQDLFDEYQKGAEIPDIVQRLKEQFSAQDLDKFYAASVDLRSYEDAKDKLILRVKNISAVNQDEDVWIEFTNIALVLYYIVEDTPSQYATAKLTKLILDKWGVQEDAVLKTALLNTVTKAEPVVIDLEKILSNPGYKGLPVNEFVERFEPPFRYVCLTTSTRMNGAAAVFYPGVAQKLAKAAGCDLYICFASIHEAMVHPVLGPEGLPSLADLEDVLNQTLQEATADEDVLTTKVIRYCAATDTFIPTR